MDEKSLLRTRASLLDSAGKGDELAWVKLYDLYQPLLREWAIASQAKYGHRKLDESDLDDAVCEVLLTLVRILRDFQYDPNQTFRGYLRTMLSRELGKIAKRQLAQADDSILQTALVDESQTDACVKTILEEEDRLQSAAVLLVARQRFREESTWLSWEQTEMFERSTTEVAKELNISAASVYSNRRRVKKTILEVSQEILGDKED